MTQRKRSKSHLKKINVFSLSEKENTKVVVFLFTTWIKLVALIARVLG